MKQSGRASFLLIAGIAAVVLVGLILLFSKESLDSVGGRFMTALAKGDVETLTKMSYIDGETPEQIRKSWDFAVNGSGKHYRFGWKIVTSTQASENSGAVRMLVFRNADQPGSYEENYQLPLVKRDGEWKVEVRGINRDMFPGLPR